MSTLTSLDQLPAGLYFASQCDAVASANVLYEIPVMFLRRIGTIAGAAS